MAEADRLSVPVLFLVEDNRLAISTRTTGRTFFEGREGVRDSLFGVSICRFDGAEATASAMAFETAIGQMRIDRKPRILLGRFSRLSDHTNSDDQTLYRTQEEIVSDAANDPIQLLHRFLTEQGESGDEFEDLRRDCQTEVQDALARARAETGLATLRGERATRPPFITLDSLSRGRLHDDLSTMRSAINGALYDNLAADSRIFILGQDIEDPKGDVFGITKGLSTVFPGRVVNSSLSESTIVGTAIGRALAGQRPVACIQFADFCRLLRTRSFQNCRRCTGEPMVVGRRPSSLWRPSAATSQALGRSTVRAMKHCSPNVRG